MKLLRRAGRVKGESEMPNKKSKFGWLRNNISLYLMLLVPVIYILVFAYYPMYGAQIAFRDYRISRGFLASEWVGMKHFIKFFTRNYQVWRIIGNTLGINLYSLLAGFPLPIVFAVLLNYLPGRRWRKTVQTVTYAPYFISVVVIAGMLLQFSSMKSGLFNNLIELVGGTRTDLIGNPDYFWSLYVWSGIWQNLGYSSVIYFSSLQSVDPQLHEAAIVDGATLVKRIWHIDLPAIMPTIIILLIMRCGQIVNVGHEKILLLQNDMNIAASEVISTYTYKVGLAGSTNQFSYATAIGLMTSAVNFILLVIVNTVSRKVSETSLF